MSPRWSCACAPARAVDRGVAEHYRPFDPRPHAPDWPAPPQSDHSPGPILLGHANNQPLNCLVDPRPAWASMLRAIELARDDPSIPGQNGIRQGRIRHFAECLAAQSTANLAKLRSLRVRKL